jgi:hypothetical protein
MADADVAITAGAGTKIDTRTVGAGTDEHRQVVVVGDPTTAAEVAAVTAANGVDVDVTRLPKSATATLANVASSATNVTLQASNAARVGWTIYNDSTQVLYLKFGATASATSYTVQLGPGAFYEMPTIVYTGIIDGIWASANGNARVTELT